MGRAGRPKRYPWALSALGACLLLAGLTTYVRAHGEVAQAGFLRLRTVTFFDVKFSRSTVPVGEDVVVTGKFKILDAWPDNLPRPEVGFLNVVAAGPTLVAKERVINGVFTPGSFELKKGEVYDFRIRLTGRLQGRFHVHPVLYVQHVGPLVGPGEWITIEPGMTPFKNPLTLLNGQTIDLERFGLGRVALWHLITAGIGVAWLMFWLLRPIIARAPLVLNGEEDLLVTPRDRKVGAVFAVVIAGVLVVGNLVTRAMAPVTIPQQVYRVVPPELPQPPSALEAKVADAVYGPTTRTVTLDLDVTNRGNEPVRLTEFATSYVTFVNQAEAGTGARHLMTVDPDGVIAPGESRRIRLSMIDPAWETERFLPIEEAQISLAGLLFFRTASGQRMWQELLTPLRTDYRVMYERVR